MNTIETRQKLLGRLFLSGIPALWCPLLTHYTEGGTLDQARMTAHLDSLAPNVNALLVAGSTSDGWELTDAETRALLEFTLGRAEHRPLMVLFGVLRRGTEEACRSILETQSWLQGRSGAHICGYVVCPPTGESLTQPQIFKALARVLEMGLPIALYQLPQVTRNAMSGQTVADLASEFPNLIFFKDSSGADEVALSGNHFDGLFLVRGAEGDYARWHRSTGGPYNGFLLSTANCFAPQLRRMLEQLGANRHEEAATISQQLSVAVDEVFRLVKSLPDGNAFTNANKAIDHFFAYGPRATEVLPPRLRSGSYLPSTIIQMTEAVLVRHGLMPSRGYCC